MYIDIIASMAADVLEPAAGDSYEFLRLLFDITFFFVVVVILLAIIQGLLPCHHLLPRLNHCSIVRFDSRCLWSAS